MTPSATPYLPSLEMSTRILLDVAPNSYRAVLQKIGHQMAADLARPYAGIMDALATGSGMAATPLGSGVMVMDQTLMGLDRPYFLIARLSHLVDVQNGDHHPVDILAVLLSPDTSRVAHIRQVSRMMRMLHDADLCALIRGAGSEDAVRALFLSLQDVALVPVHQQAA